MIKFSKNAITAANSIVFSAGHDMLEFGLENQAGDIKALTAYVGIEFDDRYGRTYELNGGSLAFRREVLDALKFLGFNL